MRACSSSSPTTSSPRSGLASWGGGSDEATTQTVGAQLLLVARVQRAGRSPRDLGVEPEPTGTAAHGAPAAGVGTADLTGGDPQDALDRRRIRRVGRPLS